MRHPLLDHQPGTLACAGTKTLDGPTEASRHKGLGRNPTQLYAVKYRK
jgi:hypothetical protein